MRIRVTATLVNKETVQEISARKNTENRPLRNAPHRWDTAMVGSGTRLGRHRPAPPAAAGWTLRVAEVAGQETEAAAAAAAAAAAEC